MAQQFWFPSALCDGQWLDAVRIGVGADGLITSIDAHSPPAGERSALVALPAMVNVHSHAFQRGFAGLSEYRTAERDSFWTWRKLMFDFVGRLSPDDVHVIARQLYLEMLAGGYAWVGEFHYLHNDLDGKPYSSPAAMAEPLVRAAKETGIGLCLLPVLYQRGGFSNEPLHSGQIRFYQSLEQFASLVDACRSLTDRPSLVNGLAIHSLRAVGIEEARAAMSLVQPGRPVHIHVAEQTAEVDDCLRVTGRRPVETLFDQFPVGPDWCLIHATHLNRSERDRIAASGAVVGLCPTTEASLGDGIFPAREFLNSGGRFALGGDSHCCTSFREELRTLETVQRLRYRQRAILGTETASTGRRLFELAASGGGQSLGVPTGRIAIGQRADWMLIDPDHPAIAGATRDRLLDRLIFVSTTGPQASPIRELFIGGHPIGLSSDRFVTQFAASSREFLLVLTKLCT
jgi:formimidoylglutamate deiminase